MPSSPGRAAPASTLAPPVSPAPAPDRRAGVAGLLGAGFALATRPIVAQTTVVTAAEGLEAAWVSIPTQNGPLSAWRARPSGATGVPIVLVVSEIFGVHEHIADVCRRLAREGYLAVAPELFARYGDPKALTDIPKIVDTIASKVPDAEVLADLDAAAAFAATDGGDAKRLAVTGFCWGGRITWLYAAHSTAVRAGVAWYGRLTGEASRRTPVHPVDVACRLRAPVLGLYGGQDTGIPHADVEAMGAALAAAGGTSRIHVYPDAPHAFHADYRPSYRGEAARDGWSRMLAWMRGHGV